MEASIGRIAETSPLGQLARACGSAFRGLTLVEVDEDGEPVHTLHIYPKGGDPTPMAPVANCRRFPEPNGERGCRRLATQEEPQKGCQRQQYLKLAPPPEPTAPYVVGSDTSKDAATGQSLTDTDRARQAVLAYLKARKADGATDEEMQVFIPMAANTQRPRRVELVERLNVVDSGRRRPTASGRPAVVWVVR